MKKLLVFLLIVGPLVFAANKKPLLDDHKAKIYAVAAGAGSAADAEILAKPEWDKLEFCDWGIVTATQDKEKHSLVSYGIVTYIKVMDRDWAPKAFGINPPEGE